MYRIFGKSRRVSASSSGGEVFTSAVMPGPWISVTLNASGRISSQWLIQKTSGPRIFDSPTDRTRTEYVIVVPPRYGGHRGLPVSHAPAGPGRLNGRAQSPRRARSGRPV